VLEPAQSAVADFIKDTGLNYLWFVALAIWGGTSSYLSRIKRDKLPFSMIELMGEWFISGFAGIITSYMCYSLGWDFYLTAAATGIAGHMGGRAIYLMESYFARKLGGGNG
jgi:hypothetical protein